MSGHRQCRDVDGEWVPETDAVAQARAWLSAHGLHPEDQATVRNDPRAPTRAPDSESAAGSRAQTRAQPTTRRSATRSQLRSQSQVEAGTQGECGPVDDATGEVRGASDSAVAVTEARAIVLRKLAARARTRQELAKALQDRGIPAEASELVLRRMSDVGLVDDGAFAADWVTTRQQRRHLSASALRRELQQKGVSRDNIDAALEPVDAAAELAAARRLVERKAASASLQGLDRTARYRRLAGALGRRGFSAGISSQVLTEVLNGVDEVS